MLDTTTLELNIPTPLADELAESHRKGLSQAVIAGLKFWLAAGAETRQLLSDIAGAQGCTKGEVMAKAVQHYYEHSGHAGTMPILPGKQLNKAQRRERNARILELVDRGMSRAAIGVEVGLSTIRVNQIVAEHRAKYANSKT